MWNRMGCGPPKKRVTMMALMVTVFMNSARKNSANRSDEYSVLNPPTSSCSASTRSKGGLFNSAVAATRETTNGTTPVAIRFHFVNGLWPLTMPFVLNVPETSSTAAMLKPRAASYDTIWAEARTDPSSGYFDPDDQPA